MCLRVNCPRFVPPFTLIVPNLPADFPGSIVKVALEKYFPEYTAGPDINKAAKYILWRFMQANRARLSVYPQ